MSSVSPPGAGSAAPRTCSSIANAGSGSHAGRRSGPTCGPVSFERYRGSSTRRSAISLRSWSSEGIPSGVASKTSTAPMCMCAASSASSSSRNVASRLVSRWPMPSSSMRHPIAASGPTARECQGFPAARTVVSCTPLDPRRRCARPTSTPTLQRRWRLSSRTSAGSSSLETGRSSCASRWCSRSLTTERRTDGGRCARRR